MPTTFPHGSLLEHLLYDYYMITGPQMAESLADPQNLIKLMEALEEIKRLIADSFEHNPDRLLDHPLINELFRNGWVWDLGISRVGIVDAMLRRADIPPAHHFVQAMRVVPERSTQVANHLLWLGGYGYYVAKLAPHRAEQGWDQMVHRGKRPTVDMLKGLAEANPVFIKRVCDMFLKGYPTDNLSRKSLMWVRSHGDEAQRAKAKSLLAELGPANKTA